MKRFFAYTCTALALTGLLASCSSNNSTNNSEPLTTSPATNQTESSTTTTNSKPVYDLDLVESSQEDFDIYTNAEGDIITLKEYTGDANYAVIPDGVTAIDVHAFSANDVLEAVTIPQSTTSVANSAFSMCTNLKEIDYGGLETIGTYAFAGCWSLEYVELPPSVGPIMDRAFYDCPALTTVVLGTGVDVIQTEAFALCPNLSSVTVPISVVYIEPTTFDGASDDLTFIVQEGSYADTWAKDNGYAVSYGS